MRRSAINLILAGLVAILATMVWLSPDTDRPVATPLTAVTPEEITRIQRESRHGPPLDMERKGSHWAMTEPHALAADEQRVGRLLEILSAPLVERFPVPGDRLSEFGLDPPLVRLRLNQMALVFGETDPIDHHRYVLFEGDLHLIKDISAHHLLAPAEAFVSPRLLNPGDEIRGLRAPDWSLALNAEGDWQLTPPALDLSPEQLTHKVNAWQQARAVRTEAVSSDQASQILEIGIKGETEPLRFAILKRPGGTLLVRPELGLGYLLSADSELLTAPGGKTP